MSKLGRRCQPQFAGPRMLPAARAAPTATIHPQLHVHLLHYRSPALCHDAPDGGWANRKLCTMEDLPGQRLASPLLTHRHNARLGRCQHDQSGLSSHSGCLHILMLPEHERSHGAVQRLLLRLQRFSM